MALFLTCSMTLGKVLCLSFPFCIMVGGLLLTLLCDLHTGKANKSVLVPRSGP